MKVILKQDVKNLGKANTLVNVNDGYARNYLIPKGLAVIADSAAINEMKMRSDAENTKRERELANAKKIAEKISDKTIVFHSKAGENGKLFGSITGKDIADKLEKDFSISVDKRRINLPEAIRTLGLHEVEIKLHQGVSSVIKVNVIDE
ncbi:MAG: 50S ribosomal protein L9 [Clostridiaceae bacterium]|jgi:large subunit ribosomal protein L9|nr:50S ribosomal protein L9 [Clostridiaceae bacterium]